MPARSNLFQRLVLEIHRGLGEGWNVQESCPLTDVITKNSREVDIVAEGEIHGYSICLSVEVCDRSRAADVTWVEGLAKKHESLPTDKLVLWSASGFTDAAKTKAAALKIEIVAPACDAPWAAIAKRMQERGIWGQRGLGILTQLNARLRVEIIREEVTREMNAAKGRR